MKQIVVVLGTRPEAIKLFPVVRALDASTTFQPVVVTTGQHHEVVDEVLRDAGVAVDERLDVMQPGAGLPALTARLADALDPTFARIEARGPVGGVLVQGDTTTTFVGALVAFYRDLPVGHVEAGLRTGDLHNPFPEEMNRRLVTRLARWHFAATPRARDNLLREAVDPASVYVTGNTVIDALHQVVARADAWEAPELAELDADLRRLVVVTAHRRESWDGGIAAVADAVRDVVRARPDVHVVWTVHPNPAVREVVEQHVRGSEAITLTPPLGYSDMARLLQRATVVCTDSGGLQEEAPAFGVPVLVTRRTTERPEGVDAGVTRLVGTDAATVAGALAELLDDPVAHAAMARVANPFGDGHAAERIVGALAHELHGGPPPQAFDPTAS